MTPALLQARRLRLKGFSDTSAVDLEIRAAECWWVGGGRGSGKSLLIKTLLGQVAADSGELLWKGQNPSRLATHEVRQARRFLGAVVEGGGLIPAWSVHANLMLGLRLQEHSIEHSADTIDSFIAQYGIPRDWLRKAAAALSADQGALMALARAALRQPEVLCIDSELLTGAIMKGDTGMAGVLPGLLAQGCALVVCGPGQAHPLEALIQGDHQHRWICMNNGSMQLPSPPNV